MNYRHGFHAGNFADVLKHLVLCELLRLLTAKDKKLFVLDTHAGSGGYDLGSQMALRTGEAQAGIARLLAAPKAGMPGPVVRYLAAVIAYDRKFGPAGGPLRRYPGSPRLIRAGLRAIDRFVACELHPQDALVLKREFAGDRSVEVQQEDGYHAVKAMLPPPERRALVLIDPPFEVTDEFERLSRAVRHGLRRFATGCYAIWYPIKDVAAVDDFVNGLAGVKSLRFELEMPPHESGLTACAMLVINPPWKLEEAMAQSLPWIEAQLGPGVRSRIVAAPALTSSFSSPVSSPTS
jgi:23S rRNA (adenine2030-N6)-methyltransferase